ncbi:phage tail protein [Pseudomonas lundensis]|uniref:phage tail protein n=1 Tax=Pseudomonas lundensis TaxID=86185 RepID=UPI00189122C7|nr:phage tail protein [Pseudomonas lundensis]QOF91219.1 phage tail protein [Pseudomonas lundensis]
MMLALGMFVFSLSTLAYQELQRQTEWRHPSNSRVGAAPARQFVGRGDDSITLPGIIFPELAGTTLSLDALRLMANTGKAWPMIEGSGRIYGLWVIESLSETKTVFFRDGTPRRIEFTLTLKRIDDDQLDLIGAASSAGVSVLRALL